MLSLREHSIPSLLGGAIFSSDYAVSGSIAPMMLVVDSLLGIEVANTSVSQRSKNGASCVWQLAPFYFVNDSCRFRDVCDYFAEKSSRSSTLYNASGEFISPRIVTLGNINLGTVP